MIFTTTVDGQMWCVDPDRGAIHGATCNVHNGIGGNVIHPVEDGYMGIHKRIELCTPECTTGFPDRLVIGATCSPRTPNCTLGDHKAPVLKKSEVASLKLDASYALGSRRNKVHRILKDGSINPCYPGPVVSWDQYENSNCGDSTCHVDCTAPFANGHVILAQKFGHSGTFRFVACGSLNLCGEIVVRVP